MKPEIGPEVTEGSDPSSVLLNPAARGRSQNDDEKLRRILYWDHNYKNESESSRVGGLAVDRTSPGSQHVAATQIQALSQNAANMTCRAGAFRLLSPGPGEGRDPLQQSGVGGASCQTGFLFWLRMSIEEWEKTSIPGVASDPSPWWSFKRV